ncbi:MAG: hypothetical protein ACQES7_04345 [Pseudomonadota bacterium]
MANADDQTANETAAFETFTSDAAAAPEEAPAETGDQGQEAAADSGEESATSQGKEEGESKEEDKQQPPADDTGAKPKRGYQKRIDRLTKRAAAAERRAQELELKLKSGTGTDNSNSQQAPASEPDPANYDDYDTYLSDLTAWQSGKGKTDQPASDDKTAGDNKAEDKGEQEDPEYTDALEDIQEAFAESRKAYSDFDEVIGASDLQITRDMVKAMADAEDPGMIAYHLGTNKDEASRIAALSPFAQAKEIGKLEASLANKPPAPRKKTTEAPDPIDPVRGADSTTKAPADMSFDEYERTMNDREQRSGKGFW